MKHHLDKERKIVSLISKNKQEATKEIYGAYAGYIAGICARFLSYDDDIKDMTQEIFIRIFTSLKSFKYSGEGSLGAWIKRISVNYILNYLRDNNRIRFVYSSESIPEITEDPPDTDKLSAEEIISLLHELPDGYRTVFNLYAIEGKPHKEIAELLGIKENSSASQYLRAKAMLAKKIKEYLKK